YRTIPTIGWLFLLQVIVGFVLSAAVLATGSRLAAAAGAGFALSTLGGYLLTVWIGLFGFTEVRTTAGIVAGILEILAFAALAAFAVMPDARSSPTGAGASRPSMTSRLQTGVPGAGWLVGGASVVALAVLLPSVATAASPAPAVTGRLMATTIGGVRVLTNAKGFTLYWFAPDTPTTSNCNGSCAAYWPPVIGKPAAGPGVTGRIGTITRSDGKTQATYNGHPLYTYIADSSPGQASGNNINLNGGLWHEVTVTG
ncbi:MAG: COG4315 family predicted lipoprotein, partial [Streptosporangiaceae bacterium]